MFTTPSTNQRLPTLTEWSVDHIRSVFEAPSDSSALQAISETFSTDLSASVNGKPLNRSGVENLVLAMRRAATTSGLKVDWERTLEVPDDGRTNRDGSFGGFYTISGLRKQVPGSCTPMDFIRQKTVTVRIESQLNDQNLDSRKIVSLVFVATDMPVPSSPSERAGTHIPAAQAV
ncbi:hypothetical protein K435DRAFT_772591 [Dendrothele bispora CBS 962.96]|uniref:Uncharacterized protein n=1 Tax=Dendrothele bispora (strain CBS 962.96) TaxID=1314807 RepID=A0A4S8MW20_DENBC|nr:hypothetical protein K435DRAFT_772591 [Dendrothele bispora CBS 962.96]